MTEIPPALDDELAVHLWQCSPCFREFTVFQDTRRNAERRVLGTKLALGAILLCSGLAVLTHWPDIQGYLRGAPEAVRSAAREVAELDFRDHSSERSASSTGKIEQKLRAPVRVLVVALPRGSEPGEYEIEIRSRSDEAKVVGSSNAVADEHMKVRCEFRGAGVNAGSYVLAWRRHGSELWHDGWFMVE